MRTHNRAGRWPRLSCVVPGFVLLVAAAPAEDRPRAAAVARSVGETASLLRREAPGGPWRVVKEDEGLPAGGLLVGAPPGALVSANGAVRLALLGDLSGTSPFPVLETAVALREPAGADLAFTLD